MKTKEERDEKEGSKKETTTDKKMNEGLNKAFKRFYLTNKVLVKEGNESQKGNTES